MVKQVYYKSDAAAQIAGSFNNWQPQDMQAVAKPFAELSEGTWYSANVSGDNIEFKFVVNGDWRGDVAGNNFCGNGEVLIVDGVALYERSGPAAAAPTSSSSAPSAEASKPAQQPAAETATPQPAQAPAQAAAEQPAQPAAQAATQQPAASPRMGETTTPAATEPTAQPAAAAAPATGETSQPAAAAKKAEVQAKKSSCCTVL